MIYTNPSDMYFSSTTPTLSSLTRVTSPALLKEINNHPVSLHQLDSHRSSSSASFLSQGIGELVCTTPGLVRSSPTPMNLDLNTNSSSVAANAAGGGTGFLLNENAMKNLNQLANKLNDAHLNNGGNISTNANPVYGRSVSAMAMTPSVICSNSGIGSTQSLASYHSQLPLSRSPIQIGTVLNGSIATKTNFASSSASNIVAVGTSANSGSNQQLIPSHTTGNGKNHKIMQIRAKFGSLGSQNNQFSSPHGFCLGMNEEIVIADTNNHRISVYEKNGTFKNSFGVAGKDEGQLWYPRKVLIMFRFCLY